MRSFLIFATLVYGVFGLGLLAIPGLFLSPYGIDLNTAGMMMCRLLGSALVGLAIVFWQVRGEAPLGAVGSVVLGNFIYNLVDVVVLLASMSRGELGVLAWGPIGLHVVLTLGFGWLTLRRG